MKHTLSRFIRSCTVVSYLPFCCSVLYSPNVLSCPVLSYCILSYLVLSYLVLYYPTLSYVVLFYPIVSYLILSYLILSHPILSRPILSLLTNIYQLTLLPLSSLQKNLHSGCICKVWIRVLRVFRNTGECSLSIAETHQLVRPGM